VVVTGCVVVVTGCVVVVVAGFAAGCVVVVVAGFVVVVVAGFVVVVVDAFFAAFCSLVNSFCLSWLLTCLFIGGFLKPSIGAIIMHVTKSITNRNIIERVIPLSNIAKSIY
jgi:hypothetical protein